MDRSPNTDTSRRKVWHQSSHCWVVGSVRIGEPGLCIGRLFRYVIVLRMACSSPSLSGEGFVHLCCSPGCPCSALLVHSPRCRRCCSLCSAGLLEYFKEISRDSCLLMIALSVINFSVQFVTDFSHQPSCFEVAQRCWNITVVLSRILDRTGQDCSQWPLLDTCQRLSPSTIELRFGCPVCPDLLLLFCLLLVGASILVLLGEFCVSRSLLDTG